MYPDDEDDMPTIPEPTEPAMDDPSLDDDSEPSEDDEDAEDEGEYEEVDEAWMARFKDLDLTDEEAALAGRLEKEIASKQFLQLPGEQGWLCVLMCLNGFSFVDASYSPIGDPLPQDEAKMAAFSRCLQKLDQAMQFKDACKREATEK